MCWRLPCSRLASARGNRGALAITLIHTQHPVMHWKVPKPPVLPKILAVPPVFIKFSVCEPKQFGGYVQPALE